MRLELAESRRLVTRSASGIGEALARELADRGADLVLVSRPQESDAPESLAQERGRLVDVRTLNPPYTKTPMLDSMPSLAWNRWVPTMTERDVARAGVETLSHERLFFYPRLAE